MEDTRNSAMERVLSIPELLDIIFGILDQPSNATNAQVCKRWSSRALDVLWREVDDLHRLFSFLAPLRRTGAGFEFEELPDAGHWKKFERYCLRVRRLEYDHPESRGRQLRPNLFDDVTRTRLRLEILPNMHTLAWKGPLNLSVTFMHAGVQTFQIWLPNDIAWDSFFRDLAVRMPNIMNLNIKSDAAILDYEVDLIDLINRLPKLRRVTFPRFYITTRLMEALSRVPDLGVIEFQINEQGCGDPDDVIPFAPLVEEGSFRALWDLSLSATFEEVSRFLGLEFAPTNLTSLYVDSSMIETAASVHGFLCCVVDTCKLLKSLSLISSRHRDSEPNDGDERYKITFDHLKPAFKLGNLKFLEVSHLYPLALKIEDIVLLASSWPFLETLILNNEPVHCLQSELTIEALLPFASHCPNLIHLGLFVDTSRTSPPPVTVPIVPFKCLERLSMGVSIIDDDKSVALYLSHVLPSGCSVECGVTWSDDEFPSDEVYKEVHKRCCWWEKVNNLLPVLIRIRVEEKDRLGVLEREMEDLRMRNDMLSDSLKSGLGQVMFDNSCIVS